MSGARSRISRTPTLRMARGSTTTRRMGSPWGPGFLRRRAKEHLLRWGASASGHPRPATGRAHDPNGWFCRNPFVPPGLRVELRSHPFGELEQATPDYPEGLSVVRPLRWRRARSGRPGPGAPESPQRTPRRSRAVGPAGAMDCRRLARPRSNQRAGWPGSRDRHSRGRSRAVGETGFAANLRVS